MASKFGILLCLLFALYGSCTRMLNTDYVTKSGNVTLNKDSYGFYVNVDFSYDYNDASDSYLFNNDYYMRYMSLGLYTSQTILTQSCLDFSTYTCSIYTCSPYTYWSATPVLPDFSVLSGYYADSAVYLDYGNWELEVNAVIATSCSSNTYSSFGYSRYGILGLGYNGTSSNFDNYSSSLFSIYLAQDGSSGTLLFWSNDDAISSSSKVGTLTTNADWNVASSSVTIDVGSSSISTTAGAIFDLNSDTIGFPSAVFNYLISDLETAGNFECTSGAYYKPECYYTGKLKDLPTIKLTIQGLEIDLPPNLYVVGENDDDAYLSNFNLAFRLVDNSYTGYNYVTSAYQNYIILGSNFMSYYYTEFSYSGGSYGISIYNTYSSPCPVWVFILAGVLGFIIIVGIVACCIRKRRNRIKAQAQARQFSADGINASDQAPLVTNVQVNVPYNPPSYPPAYGNEQGNYGYPQQFANQPYPYGYNNMQQPGFQPYTYVPPVQEPAKETK